MAERRFRFAVGPKTRASLRWLDPVVVATDLGQVPCGIPGACGRAGRVKPLAPLEARRDDGTLGAMTEGQNEDLSADWAQRGDALSQFVHAAGLQGIVLSSLELGAPWRVGPGRQPHPVLHFVREGTAHLLTPERDEPVVLEAGDVALFPRGGQYVLSDSHPSPASDVVAIEGYSEGNMCSHRIGGDGPATRLTCCGYRFLEASRAAPLLGFLPELVVVRSGSASGDVRSTLDELIGELRARRMGSDGIVARLAELAYLRVLRNHLDQDAPLQPGLMSALTDPQIGRALQQIHAELQRPWTVASLASSVGMSRAAFAELFAKKVGESPMRYLQQCRIHEAAGLITATELSFSEIGRRVGYTDPTAFSRAFRRETGRSAREYRQVKSIRSAT